MCLINQGVNRNCNSGVTAILFKRFSSLKHYAEEAQSTCAEDFFESHFLILKDKQKTGRITV